MSWYLCQPMFAYLVGAFFPAVSSIRVNQRFECVFIFGNSLDFSRLIGDSNFGNFENFEV